MRPTRVFLLRGATNCEEELENMSERPGTHPFGSCNTLTLESWAVRFVFNFSTHFRSMLVVINNYWYVFVEIFISRIIVSSFIQVYLGVVLLRVVIKNSFTHLLFVERVYLLGSNICNYKWIITSYRKFGPWFFSLDLGVFYINFVCSLFICLWFVSNNIVCFILLSN